MITAPVFTFSPRHSDHSSSPPLRHESTIHRSKVSRFLSISAEGFWKRLSDEIRLTYQSAATSSLLDSNGSVQSRQNKKAFGVRGAHSSDTNKWNRISSQLNCRYIYDKDHLLVSSLLTVSGFKHVDC